MNNKKIFILLIAIISIIVSSLCVGIGSIYIDPIISFKILINSITNNFYNITWQKNLEIIIMQIRIPRIILGFLSGASMSIIGVLMQTLTKNSLAEPYILGVSSGASAGAVSIIILSETFTFLRLFSVSQGAFIGALLSILIVFSIFTKYSMKDINLVLIGVGVSAFFSALTTFIVYSAKHNSQVITAMFWMTGSLSSATKEVIFYPFIISIISLILICFFADELDILLLGDSVAKSLGVNITFIKVSAILISTITISSVVSITGIIGFVGLIIPHISRKIIGTHHINLIPFSFFLGGLFLVVTDTFARTIFSPEELPIGILTSFIGAPLFLWIIKQNYTMGENSK